jgi:G3E family GTPase
MDLKQEAARRKFPITLLTGFLGSGKTTLLNRLLSEATNEKIAVVVNEFGEISLDHLLVAQSTDEIVELANGCLCCALRSDIVHTLFGLFAARVRGEIAPFDRALIETSGMADPAPILHTLFTDPALAPRFTLDGVVVTVDAVNGSSTLDRHIEAVKQVAAGDFLLITKADIASPADVEQLKSRIRGLNPGAVIEQRAGAASPVANAFGIGSAHDRLKDIDAWIEGHDHAHHDHRAVEGEHTSETRSLTLTLDKAVRWSDLNRWIGRLQELRGPGLLRLKGLVNIAEKPGTPLVLHAVQHVFHPPMFLPEWPSGDHCTRLVFILHQTPEEAIAETFPILRGER